jgi:hypothetical protein
MPFFAQAYYVGTQQQVDHKAALAPESGTDEPETGAPDDKPGDAPNAAGTEPAGKQDEGQPVAQDQAEESEN